jgi:hypothetical protein
LQTDKFFQVKSDDDPQWLSRFSGLKASCRVFSKFPSIFTNLGQQRMRHNEYDHSRARECLGLALGFLMNYDELWSSSRVPFRIAERWEDRGEKNADQATEIPNTSKHIDISTYRHIDMACLKNFFPLPRTMIYDVISFQTCSNSGTFTFDVMKSLQICPFQEPSYLMWFLFSNFPFQELSHLMWNLFRFFPFQERSYLMWFLFRNCPFQELSHFMLNLFRFVPFQQESHLTWFSFPFK